jgi:Chaperone of endosialidase
LTGPLVIAATSADQALVLKRPTGYSGAQGPHIAWQDADGTRIGYLRFGNSVDGAPGARLAADANQPIRFYTGGDQFVIDTTTVTCNNKLAVTAAYAETVKITGTTTGYIGFYEGATRRCYMGHYPQGHAVLKADTGNLRIGTFTAGQPIYFDVGNVAVASIDDGASSFGYYSASASNHMMFWEHATGYLQCSSNSGGNPATPIHVVNKIGTGVGASHKFTSFRTNNGEIGSITRNASASSVLFNTSSDYRLKDVLGPISDGVARIDRLRPYRVIWKDDPTHQQVDAFLAHEVAEVVPEAVTGEKDAVATVTNEALGTVAGEPVYQQLDYSRLVPTLVAAVQELSSEVRELRAEVRGTA